MSITLHPGIGNLDPESLCYSIYAQLYQNFFDAQTPKSEDNPFGIEEGDDTSVRLRNTAYGFAEAISGAVESGGGSGGSISGDYLELSGGNLTGPLTADYGFGAGIANRRILDIYRTALTDVQGEVTGYDYGMRLTGDLKVEGCNLYFGGQQFITYIPNLGTMFVRYPKMDFSTSSMRSRGDLLFGENRQTGIYISPVSLQVAGSDVFHAGNAGHAAADWAMKDAVVAGDLSVAGTVSLSGLFRALHGAELGGDGTALMAVTEQGVSCMSNLSFSAGCGVRIGGVIVLQGVGAQDVRLEGAGGHLLLGGENTQKVRLMSNVTDIDGDNVLISKYGGAYFPDSLRVKHNYGDDLLSTFRSNADEEGIVVHKQLRFGDEKNGAWITGVYGQWAFCSASDHTSEAGGEMVSVTTLIGHTPSMSLRRPMDRSSDTLFIGTMGDFITFGNPIEASSVGIDGSYTRLEDGCLYFTDDVRLQKTTGGIRHYGNALFARNLSSELFTSGLAGTGWAILGNATTGDAEATFDCLTVRKRVRVYELVVQRTRATNGALWVSDTCSGDRVVRIT